MRDNHFPFSMFVVHVFFFQQRSPLWFPPGWSLQSLSGWISESSSFGYMLSTQRFMLKVEHARLPVKGRKMPHFSWECVRFKRQRFNPCPGRVFSTAAAVRTAARLPQRHPQRGSQRSEKAAQTATPHELPLLLDPERAFMLKRHMLSQGRPTESMR